MPLFAKIVLFPFSLLYGGLTAVRNLMFNAGILRQEDFPLPVIGIGNLSAGGTGKTPLVEYLARLLSVQGLDVATLSRGYGRKTRGFREVNPGDAAADAGDEPVQLSNNLPGVSVYVCESRTRGIERILGLRPQTGVVILDDAFQHRYVRPGISILTTAFSDPYYRDLPLPAGRLREFRCGASRAHIIVVTGCPPATDPSLRKEIIARIRPTAGQHVFFSHLKYHPPKHFLTNEVIDDFGVNPPEGILLFSGIGNPAPLADYLRMYCSKVVSIKFNDHHAYTGADAARIIEKFRNIASGRQLMITTAKDRCRLLSTPAAKLFTNLPLYYIPVTAAFEEDDAPLFEQTILQYVRKNNQNR